MDRNLIHYLPEIMREMKELSAALQVENEEFESAWNITGELLNDQFISTATKKGVARWEKILQITPKATEELELRKFRVLTRLNEQLPYTMGILIQQIESLCGNDGYVIILDNDSYVLKVRIKQSAIGAFEEIRSMLKRIVPANMVIEVSVKYNQHIDLLYKHGQLKNNTHYNIRNGVISNGQGK